MNNATEEKHILGIRGLNIEDCNKYADVINAKMRTIYDRITIFTLILEQLKMIKELITQISAKQ
jgi:hypothetical protein